MKKGILALTLALVLSPTLTFSADYKNWLPYIPDTIDGKKKTRKDEAGNVNFHSVINSTFSRTYGSEPNEITLLIIWDPSGNQILATKMGLEALRHRPIETSEAVDKLITVQGFTVMYGYNVESKRAIIQGLLSDTSVFQFSATGGRNESYYINLLKSINLKKILNTM